MATLRLSHDYLVKEIQKHADWAQTDKEEYTGPKPPNRGSIINDEWWKKAGEVVTKRAEAARKMAEAAVEFERLTQEFYGMSD
jgi:hypothetical protein